jgi:hypothetical protein
MGKPSQFYWLQQSQNVLHSARKTGNSKHEIPNYKQYLNSKVQNSKQKRFDIWIFNFWICLRFRICDLEFSEFIPAVQDI